MNAKLLLDVLRDTSGLITYQGRRVPVLYLLHPVLIILSGYAIVRWPLSLVTKSLLFMLICFVAGWLVYQLMMRPAQTGKKTIYGKA